MTLQKIQSTRIQKQEKENENDDGKALQNKRIMSFFYKEKKTSLLEGLPITSDSQYCAHTDRQKGAGRVSVRWYISGW